MGSQLGVLNGLTKVHKEVIDGLPQLQNIIPKI